MATHNFTIRSEEHQGPTIVTIKSTAATFLALFDLTHLAGGSGNNDAVRIATIGFNEKQVEVTGPAGEGTHWQAALLIDSPDPTIDFEFSKVPGGDVIFTTDNDSFTLNNQAVPLNKIMTF